MKTALLFVVVCGMAAAIFAAEPAKPTKASTLDDELFKGLDDATTAPGVKPKATTPAAKETSAKPALTKPPTKPANPLDEELLKALEGDDAASAKPKQSKPHPGGDGGKTAVTKPAS